MAACWVNTIGGRRTVQPFYQEISHIPLFIYHPDFPNQGGTRRNALTQTIDIMPTLAEVHGVETPETVEGISLLRVLEEDKPIRSSVIYGLFGAATNISDGRYTYFRYPEDMDNQELFEYTLMPTHVKTYFKEHEFDNVTFERSFVFLRGYPVMKLPARKDARRPPGQGGRPDDANTVLYDLENDPGQENADRQ